MDNRTKGKDPEQRKDPVQILFENLPDPNKYHSLLPAEPFPITKRAITNFNWDMILYESTDPDSKFISKHASRVVHDTGRSVHLFYNQLATMALSKDIPEDDGSAKAERLRFYKWLALGSKDEDSPFLTPEQRQALKPPISHAFLPDIEAACTFCGHEKASKECDKCALSIGKKYIFSTPYCDGFCQMAHEEQHEADCRNLRELRQRALVLERLLKHYYESTIEFSAVKLIEKENMDVIQFNSRDVFTRRANQYFHKFPYHLCSSPEQAEAMKVFMRCNEISTYHGLLVELILKPVCAKIENVIFCPKNIRRPTQYVRNPDDHIDFNSLRSHEVLRLTLPSGAQMVVDATAAQYGWQELIAPWAQYEKHRVRFIVEAAELVVRKEPVVVDLRKLAQVKQGESLYHVIHLLAALFMSDGVKGLSTSETDGLADLFNGSWDDIDARSEEYVTKVLARFDLDIKQLQSAKPVSQR